MERGQELAIGSGKWFELALGSVQGQELVIGSGILFESALGSVPPMVQMKEKQLERALSSLS